MRARSALIALLLLTAASLARAQDANYALTPAAAEKMRPLVVAWQKVMFMPAEWRGICESSQRYPVE
jgi:hypothetical protein